MKTERSRTTIYWSTAVVNKLLLLRGKESLSGFIERVVSTAIGMPSDEPADALDALVDKLRAERFIPMTEQMSGYQRGCDAVKAGKFTLEMLCLLETLGDSDKILSIAEDQESLPEELSQVELEDRHANFRLGYWQGALATWLAVKKRVMA